MRELLKKCGSMEQLAGIRLAEYQEGIAKGLCAYQVKNGPLAFSVMKDKCLDISELSFCGQNISFLAANGFSSMEYAEAFRYSDRSVMGGMMFTCGPENVGPGDEKRQLPTHGSFRFTPAGKTGASCFWDEKERYHLRIEGTMEAGGLFEPRLVLERVIETIYGTNRITITDTLSNPGFEEVPCMLLYHCNFSYPFLNPGCQVTIPSSRCVLREAPKEQTSLPYDEMEEPEDGGKEQVFFHEAAAGADGAVTLSVKNKELGITASLKYDKQELPKLIQWKSMVSGHYVLGLEPANCLVFGRAYEEAKGTLPMLQPGERKTVHLELSLELQK